MPFYDHFHRLTFTRNASAHTLPAYGVAALNGFVLAGAYFVHRLIEKADQGDQVVLNYLLTI
jgi:hypothetical protein